MTHTQLKIYAALLVLLFGGILILPRIGQVIWIDIVMAIYIRATLVHCTKRGATRKSPARRLKVTNEPHGTMHVSVASSFPIQTGLGL